MRSGGRGSCARLRSSPRWPQRASEIALETYQLLGCAGFARVDLMLAHDTGELFVLEANTIPGLTETSLLPQAAEAAGISFDQLVESVLAAVPG